MLLLHGIIAIASMFLLGWVTSQHVMRWWPRRLRRMSGGTFAALLALLAASGFALFFVSDDGWQHRTAVIHDIAGVGIAVSGVQHWFFGLGRRRKRRI